MKFEEKHFICSPRLLRNVDEINEIYSCIENIRWEDEFEIDLQGINYKHQKGYNKAFEIEFLKYK